MKAFTILELLVVLIISSVLAFLSVGIVTNFSLYFKKSLAQQGVMNDMLLLSMRLKEDMVKADVITGNAEMIKIYNNNKVRTYEFYPDKIFVSDENIADSIFLKTTGIQVEHLSAGIVNYLEIHIAEGEQEYVIIQHKTYSSTFLFENSRNNINTFNIGTEY